MEGHYVEKTWSVFESHSETRSETFVKKAAFRLNENKTRAVRDPPKRKIKETKDIR